LVGLFKKLHFIRPFSYLILLKCKPKCYIFNLIKMYFYRTFLKARKSHSLRRFSASLSLDLNIRFRCSSRGRPKIAYSWARKLTRVGVRGQGPGVLVVLSWELWVSSPWSPWIKGAFKRLTAKWKAIEIFMNLSPSA